MIDYVDFDRCLTCGGIYGPSHICYIGGAVIRIITQAPAIHTDLREQLLIVRWQGNKNYSKTPLELITVFEPE